MHLRQAIGNLELPIVLGWTQHPMYKRQAVIGACLRLNPQFLCSCVKRGGSTASMATSVPADSEQRKVDDFLSSFINHEQRGVPVAAGTPQSQDFDLGRMRRLLVALGDPQRRWRAVHVAGSKGVRCRQHCDSCSFGPVPGHCLHLDQILLEIHCRYFWIPAATPPGETHQHEAATYSVRLTFVLCAKHVCDTIIRLAVLSDT